MPQLSLECPHCRTEQIGFAPIAAVQVKPALAHTLLFLQCEGCGHGLIAVTNSYASTVQQWIVGAISSPGDIVMSYPRPVALQAPPDVPPTVGAAFLSGLDNLARKGGTNAAAIMFRRAIEIAVKSVHPTAPKGDNLNTRIDNLSPDVATPAMKKWAHHIRLDANDAAHEIEEFSEEDAKQLHVFAEMFLTYAFTLPKMLERATTPPPPPPPQKS
jgi:hypothetical protein